MSFSINPNNRTLDIMMYFINNITPQELHAQLTRAVNSGMMIDNDARALAQAIARTGIPVGAAYKATYDRTEYHCARCHQNYYEKDNNPAACRIRHMFPRFDFDFIDEAEENISAPKYFLRCCEKYLEVGENHDVSHFAGTWCVSDRHTTIAKQVKYNGLSVMTCENNGCPANPVPTNGLRQVRRGAPPIAGRGEQSEARVVHELSEEEEEEEEEE